MAPTRIVASKHHAGCYASNLFMKELEAKRDRLTTRSFYIALETLFIFGVPALVAVYTGKWFVERFSMGEWIIYTLLAGTFIVSWVILIARVRKASQAIKRIQKEIQDLENNSTNTL